MKSNRKPWRVIFIVQTLSWLIMVPGAAAQDSVPLEYEVKAAFLFNFGKFVSWPTTGFVGTNAPMVIGVLGGNPFKDDLKNMIAGKSINGHPLVVRLLAAPDAGRNCQILFICRAAQKDATAILASLHGANVLTVTENLPHFASSGFAINLVMAADTIRFEINNPAAEQAGLTISSKLRSLALPAEP
jgi:hypothetical protein